MRFASCTSCAAFSSLCRPTSARNSCSESAAPESDSLAHDRGLRGLLRLLLLGVDDGRADLEPHRLELARDLLDLLGGELLLGDEALELRWVDPPALLGALHDRLQLVGFEQFDELVLRQACGQSFRVLRSTISLTLRALLRSFHGIETANRVTNPQRPFRTSYFSRFHDSRQCGQPYF